MRSPLAFLVAFTGIGVLLFVGGMFWGAAFVGAPSGNLASSLATGNPHTWVATILMTFGAASFASAPFVAALVWFRGPHAKAHASQSATFPADADGSVLDQLVKAGANISKAHHPEFFLYFPDEATAVRIAALVEADGFRVTVQRAATGDNWLCLATKSMVLTYEGMTAIRRRFTLLASENRGEYDGWGTSVER